MTSPKEIAISIIRALPDDADMNDILNALIDHYKVVYGLQELREEGYESRDAMKRWSAIKTMHRNSARGSSVLHPN